MVASLLKCNWHLPQDAAVCQISALVFPNSKHTAHTSIELHKSRRRQKAMKLKRFSRISQHLLTVITSTLLSIATIGALFCSTVQANTLGRSSSAGQYNITAINQRDIVRTSNINNDHQYETSHMHQHHHHLQPPSIPAHYVKLGNNTSSSARNFINGQHALRVPAPTNQSVIATGDLWRIDETQATQKKSLFEKICIGTSNRLSGQSNKTDHYQTLVERYRNCTYVIGNLEITWLERSKTPLDLSFLESIREITGYLLIAYVDVERISMPNLQIIRGREVFKLSNGTEFTLFAMQNQLRSLELPNLREIINGDVGFFHNRNLCHMRTIEWGELLTNGTSRYLHDATVPEPNCPSCHDSCRSSCWGPGPDLCQKFSKTHCSPQCEKGRCFGTAPRECCHLFCAGGCTGPKQTDCLACKYFNNDGECIQECPSMNKYNPSKFVWEPDPNGKYAFGATCVKECPVNLLRDNGACVRSCPSDKREVQGECVSCVGPCPKNCQGVDVVNSRNIEQFVNCTEIQGSITILDTSFDGYTDVNSNNTMGTRYEPMHPSRLKVFETVRVITGYLNIQAAHRDFGDLSFFSKLEAVEGRQTTDMFHSLSIIKTSLVSLNLRSLKRVRGGILIKENKEMCFAHASQFIKNGIAKSDEVLIDNNGNDKVCRSIGLKCHEQCGAGSCWGPGQDECISCLNYKLEDYCVQNCNATRQIGILSFDLGNKTCSKCHPECREGCTGSDAKSCRACKNFKDGPYCVAECPKHKYNDNGICQDCHRNCADGCTGPSGKLGSGGCNSCDKVLIESINPMLIARCLKADEQCPEGYYQEYGAPVSNGHPLKSLERRPICRKCHPKCKSCNGYGAHKDVCECAGYVANDQCEDSCPRDFYADEKTRRCIKCSRECNGCFGPTEADCLNCRVYRIYYDSSGPVASARIAEKSSTANRRLNGSFNCTSQCPPDKPHRVSESNLLDPYCSEDPGPDSDGPRIVSLGSTSFLFLLITSASVTFCVMVYKCKTDRDKLSTVKLTMRLSGFDDVEPLNQSNLKPNLAPLRSIKETELRKGDRIGSGVGGTVYMGFWHPEGQEDKDPTPVAIKVLRDNGQPNMHKEFLDEAYIMASVNHPNLVKLLAVCMTPTQLILVTPLMAIGCLLDYVKDPVKNAIDSKDLLEWGKQIAKGMAYLEERRMVHRDLALRNVLLQTKRRALISDFGLAKFLEVDQNEYKVAPSGGTCLPIKWLAPECIRERKFTHKSDVWAFGVTIWELVTFGERPFKKIANNEICKHIMEGARLEQPSYVSAEVYKVMYACWFYNPEDRPNFKSLAETFCNFARDPARYLICNSGVWSMRGSDSDENECNNEYGSDPDSTVHEISTPQSAQPTTQSLNHQTHTEFDFNTRNHHSESDTPTFSASMNLYPNVHQQAADDVFSRSNRQMSSKSSSGTVTDPNNNLAGTSISDNNGSARRLNNDSCWTVNHTVSTNSLGQRSMQPTDSEDYLIPSPCSNEDKFSRWPLLNERQLLSSRLPPGPQSSNDPPHSAGLIGISNHEYFLTRMNYGNPNGQKATKASSGLIPTSLV